MCLNCGTSFGGCASDCPGTPAELAEAAKNSKAMVDYLTRYKSQYDDGMTESINHPGHYGGDTTYEAIKVIEAWELGFCLGNTVKYISRAGKKDKAKTVEDLKKALWYLQREVTRLES